MFPSISELKTESDVEQKLIWPLLTSSFPSGLAFHSSDVVTKLSIRRLEIGKGASSRLYYPDYLVALAGLPVLIIEAKAVGESVDAALYEARLYANEVNALFPHNVNPVKRVLACNGMEVWTSPIDTASPDLVLRHEELTATNPRFASLVELCNRDSFQDHVDLIRRKLRKTTYRRPVTLVGGASFQAEELAQNTFGATIVGDYGHIFNPVTREDRARVVREAYVPSLRQQRYVEPIDRIIRNAVAPKAAQIRPIENSAEPVEITKALQEAKKLEDQVVLLVGSVGAGKSTFIDHLSIVALPEDLRSRTVWLRLNLNEAPLAVSEAYRWTATTMIEEFKLNFPSIDFDERVTIEKMFGAELSALKKGPLSLLDPSSTEYLTRIVDRLSELQGDPLTLAKGMARFLCTGGNRLLVVVLDNCDKRSRDEQLTMFQVAQWVRGQFRCLVVLPIRDVTFDLHRSDPPLDTALKQFVFRIEPPQFSDVLQGRVRLALNEMIRAAPQGGTLSFQLPNGIRVTYPAEDQALYLASMLRSLYAHDRFVRQVITGLAGRDVRKAMEIFLDFCMSGHIGEDEIYKIRFFDGQYVLPLSIVARVLLRMQRRFYDGDKGYLKNLVQCDPADSLPDHFVRLTLLHWFQKRLSIKGPAGVNGFHRVSDMLSDLSALGHDGNRVRKELDYLLRAGCIVAEHLRVDQVSDEDLIKITASGVVHLQLMANPDYLAACAEDTAISDEELCKKIAEKLSKGIDFHFSPTTTAITAIGFVEYLRARASELLRSPESYLTDGNRDTLKSLREAEAGLSAAEVSLPERLFIGNLPFDASEIELRETLEAAGIALKTVTFPVDANTKRSRGFAFVEPHTKNGIAAALDLDGSLMLQGRRLRVNEAHRLDEEHIARGGRERPAPALSRRIYIGNLPYSFSEMDVRAELSAHDLTAVDILLLVDQKTGRSRCSGFAEMSSLDEAAKAIGALNGAEVQGRRLIVRPAEERERR
jgi:hypothetical protein